MKNTFKFLGLGIATFTSLTACSGIFRERIGEKEGYAYAKGYKYFDVYLGDEVPKTVDYPGYEGYFSYNEEGDFLELTFNSYDKIKVTTQLYFSDLDNDGIEEICASNNRFTEDKVGFNGVPVSNNDVHGYSIYSINYDQTSDYFSCWSGMTGASGDHYCYFSLDANNEFIINTLHNDGKKVTITKQKYFFNYSGNLYHGFISGSEDVD